MQLPGRWWPGKLYDANDARANPGADASRPYLKETVMATARKPASAAQRAAGEDALSMLKTDHDKVRELFKQFEEMMEEEGSEKQKEALVQQVCNEIKLHAQLEEEIFYPAVRAAIDDDDLMDEAAVEHAEAKELIEQIESMRAGDDLFDAKVVVLSEQVEHHATEEEDEMFPKVKKAKVDITALGLEIMERKRALMMEMGMAEESLDLGTSSSKKKSKSTHGRTLT